MNSAIAKSSDQAGFSCPTQMMQVKVTTMSRLRKNQRIDFQAIAELALLHVDSLLEEILPMGRREGQEYVALNPTRQDNTPGSFRVNVSSGAWADFATNDRGGDLISLHA